MFITFRLIIGALGLTLLVGTISWVVHLLAMEPDVRVLLAGYMAIGGILAGVFFLFYAITGEWQRQLPGQKN